MRPLTLRAASSAIKTRTSHDMPRSAARQSRIFNYRGKSTSCAHSALPRACLANAVVNNARTELAASFVQSINISANCFVCLKCFDLRYFEFKPLTSGQSLTYKPKSNYQAFFCLLHNVMSNLCCSCNVALQSHAEFLAHAMSCFAQSLC